MKRRVLQAASKAASQKTKSVYLLSDSSGNLLEHFFSAILTQFPKKDAIIKSLPFLYKATAVTKQIEAIKDGVVFHAVASDDLKITIAKACRQRKLPCWDVTGPTVDFFEKAMGIRRFSPPQPLHGLDAGYMGRIRALEFAIQHDDGRRVEDLDKAEIIIVGVSRVSKSPTSLFLAYRGFRVANVSLVPGMALPGCLDNHPLANVVALTMHASKLAEIRQRRFAAWKLDKMDYEKLDEVDKEVRAAEQIYQDKGWPVLDVTELTVEETSSLILSELKLKPKIFPLSE